MRTVGGEEGLIMSFITMNDKDLQSAVRALHPLHTKHQISKTAHACGNHIVNYLAYSFERENALHYLYRPSRKNTNLAKFLPFHEVIIIQNIEILQLSPKRSGNGRALTPDGSSPKSLRKLPTAAQQQKQLVFRVLTFPSVLIYDSSIWDTALGTGKVFTARFAVLRWYRGDDVAKCKHFWCSDFICVPDRCCRADNMYNGCWFAD